MKTIVIPILFSAALAGARAGAQSIGELLPDVAAQSPVVEQSAGVEYINGGAGTEARDAIAAVQSRFPLRIVLSGKGGEYLVADSLSVRDGTREVLTVRNAGPLVMMNLPPGRYTVEASYLGKTHSTTVELGREPRTLNWSWPAA